MTTRALTVAHEPPGKDWQLVEAPGRQVIAHGSIEQVRLARVQYEDAHWAAGLVPASTWIRPARGWRVAGDDHVVDAAC